MRIHIAVFFLLCVLPVIRAAEGPLCFSCDRVDRLESCKTVTRCEEDEQCLVSKFRTNTGGEIVNFQCQKKTTCELLGSFNPFGRREEEIQLCVECCEGDLCQSSTKNCPGGTPSHPQKSKLCYMCDEIDTAETCKHVEFCPDEDDLCYIHHSIAHTGDLIKSLGCKKLSACKVWTTVIKQHTHNPGFFCFECCNETACNSNCHSVYKPTTSPLTTPPTTPLPTSPPTPPPTVSTAFLTEKMLTATAPSKPTVVVQPRSAEAVQGRNQDVVFSCSFTGVPTPQIFWFYKGPAGKPDVLHEGYTTVGASSNLTIKDPKVSDSGTYICAAFNKQGTELASATLTVHALFKPIVTMSRPHVVDGSPNPLRIHCDSRGSTNVSYSWQITHPSNPTVTMKLNSDTVTLNPATATNVGLFTCFVTNSVGRESSSLEVHVEVLEAPAIDVHPNTTIREGDSREARLTCESRGLHNLSIRLSSDSKLLKQATGVNRLEYVIHDPRVQDTGDYTCTVSKDNVTKSASVHLTVFASAKCYQAGTLDQPVPFEEAVDIRTNSTCSMEAPYCISVITASGGHHSNFNVYQGCASATACDQSSDRMNPKDEPCFHGIVGWMTYPNDLLCTFCCTGDFCSENFEPDSATVYKSKTSP